MPPTSPRPFDLISLGECLVEFNRRDDGSFNPTFAGDAFNVLFYATRLGLRTAFVSAVGDDLFTPMILDGIEREGIDTSHLLRLGGLRNGLYFIELDAQREYTFHFWRQNSAATETLLRNDLDELAGFISGSRYFLFTGVGLAILKDPARLDQLLLKLQGCTQIIFDTNYRARLWNSPDEYRRRVESVLPFVDVLLPTRGDIEAAWPDDDIGDILRRLREMGPEMIAMKSGADGCGIWSDDGLIEYPALSDIEVIDTTGAGDAFNAGFIAGLVRGEELGACCDSGQRVAAWALVVQGAINLEFGVGAIGDNSRDSGGE
jgi:2-dehydro-3-deoxygluconokinase